MAHIDHLHAEPAKEEKKAKLALSGQPAGDGNGRTPSEPAGSAALSTLELRTRQIGQQLLAVARERSEGVLSSRFWSDHLMTWAMRDQGTEKGGTEKGTEKGTSLIFGNDVENKSVMSPFPRRRKVGRRCGSP